VQKSMVTANQIVHNSVQRWSFSYCSGKKAVKKAVFV